MSIPDFEKHLRELENTVQLTVNSSEADRLKRQAIMKRMEAAYFGFDSPIEDEVEVIFINDSMIASLTNISLVLGFRKGGKSSLLSLILGDRNGMIKTQFPPGKHWTIFADNEQSGKYLRVLQDRISKLNGGPPANIKFLKLRQFNRRERLEIIELCLEETPEAGLLIIDNVKDICPDFNDPAEADKIVTTLIQWAQKYNVHIMCVLHLNKGNGLSRGHLGSELENKAETVIKIRKDENIQAVWIEPEATRNRPFDPISFSYQEDGTPVINEGVKASDRKPKSGRKPMDYSELTHANLLDEVFKNTSSYRYEELWRTVKTVAAKHDITLGDNAAKDWVTHYKAEGLVRVDNRTYVRPSV